MMSVLRFLLLGMFILATPGLSAEAAQCISFDQIAVRVAVREPPVSVKTSFDLLELSAMLSRSTSVAKHPAFGFYRLDIGYAQPRIVMETSSDPGNGPVPCPSVLIDAELVVTDQQIEIARDPTACQLPAVISHYRRHAAAASLALHRFAAGLAPDLKRQVVAYLGDPPLRSESDADALRGRVSELLDEAVGVFMASVPKLQEGVDTPAEIRSLTESCSST